MDAVLALDIGGTKLAAGVVDPTGRPLSRARRHTPPNAHADTIYAALLEALAEARAAAGEGAAPLGVGVGCGGPMRRREGLVSPLNIPGWRDFPLVARLQTDTGLPVTLDNDAKAFAMGEHLFGAGRGRPHMLGVVVSTGVGGGVIERGALLHGRTGNAGHVGHVVAEPEGPECACGGRGCVEAIASGPSIVRLARAALARGTPSSLADPPRAEPLTTRDVARAAAGGDPLSLDLFRRAGRALGVGFAGAAALADFDLVVVGGGVSAVGELLLGPIREAIGRHVGLDYIRGLTVTAAGNGADAGLVGAAALMLSQRPAR